MKRLFQFRKRSDINSGNVDLIYVNGLCKAVKILHITDAHISVKSIDEKWFHHYSARMDNAFKRVRHYITKVKTTPKDIFLGLLDLAVEEKVDLIVLSGDIFNNPSASSVDFVYKALESKGIPYIYIAGNHDWHYEGMDGTTDYLRSTWTEKSLKPLYKENNPLYSANVYCGINFVAIDNSTYQINEEQLEFFKKQLKHGDPVVLILHIPLYTETEAKQKNILVCGAPHWGWDTDKKYKLEKRDRWHKGGNLLSTTAFLESVRSSSNILAVLAGHTHVEQINQVSEKVTQYITGSSLDGHYRLIRFEDV